MANIAYEVDTKDIEKALANINRGIDQLVPIIFSALQKNLLRAQRIAKKSLTGKKLNVRTNRLRASIT